MTKFTRASNTAGFNWRSVTDYSGDIDFRNVMVFNAGTTTAKGGHWTVCGTGVNRAFQNYFDEKDITENINKQLVADAKRVGVLNDDGVAENKATGYVTYLDVTKHGITESKNELKHFCYTASPDLRPVYQEEDEEESYQEEDEEERKENRKKAIESMRRFGARIRFFIQEINEKKKQKGEDILSEVMLPSFSTGVYSYVTDVGDESEEKKAATKVINEAMWEGFLTADEELRTKLEVPGKVSSFVAIKTIHTTSYILQQKGEKVGKYISENGTKTEVKKIVLDEYKKRNKEIGQEKAAEDKRKAEEEKAAEDKRKAEEEKAAEDKRKAEEEKAAEDKRKAEEEKARRDREKAPVNIVYPVEITGIVDNIKTRTTKNVSTIIKAVVTASDEAFLQTRGKDRGMNVGFDPNVEEEYKKLIGELESKLESESDLGSVKSEEDEVEPEAEPEAKKLELVKKIIIDKQAKTISLAVDALFNEYKEINRTPEVDELMKQIVEQIVRCSQACDGFSNKGSGTNYFGFNVNSKQPISTAKTPKIEAGKNDYFRFRDGGPEIYFKTGKAMFTFLFSKGKEYGLLPDDLVDKISETFKDKSGKKVFNSAVDLANFGAFFSQFFQREADNQGLLSGRVDGDDRKKVKDKRVGLRLSNCFVEALDEWKNSSDRELDEGAER